MRPKINSRKSCTIRAALFLDAGVLRALLFAIMCALLVVDGPSVFAQSRIGVPDAGVESGSDGATTSDGDAGRATQDPPSGFGLLELGIGIDAAKERLKEDPNFIFRGDPDVSLLRNPNESLLEARGVSFVERGYFQFHDDRLYTIILELDTTSLDHYTMYTTLTERYGDPTSLDPEQSIWEFESIRISLERPLRLKYIDLTIFEEILASQDRTESMSRLSRDRFLEQF